MHLARQGGEPLDAALTSGQRYGEVTVEELSYFGVTIGEALRPGATQIVAYPHAVTRAVAVNGSAIALPALQVGVALLGGYPLGGQGQREHPQKEP